MTESAVVIGGGAIGMASGYYLRESGWQVTVVDKGEMGRGCSYGNACLISPSHNHPIPGPGVISQALRWMLTKDSPFYIKPRLDPELFRWLWNFRRYCNSTALKRGSNELTRLSRQSLELFEDLSKSLDFFYQRKGLIHAYVTERGAAGAAAERDEAEAAGFRAQLMTREETLELEPALSGSVRAGLFIEDDAHGHCFGYVRALATHLENQGAKLLENRTVSRIGVERGRANRVLVTSPEEEIPADLVVLAAGAWTPSLTKPLGISIPIQPAKGCSSTIYSYPGAPKIPILIPERRVIITPLDSRLRFAGTLELAGYDLSLNETRCKAVVRAAREVLGSTFEMRNEEPWCGLRPVLPNGLPFIDWAPGVKGLFIATGHAMLGFTQSPITGRRVAESAKRGQA